MKIAPTNNVKSAAKAMEDKPVGEKQRQFDEFCDETSFHGLAEYKRGRWMGMKPFWLLVLIGFSIVCGIQIYGLLKNYFDNPILTSAKPKPVTHQIIPPILICLGNGASAPKAAELPPPLVSTSMAFRLSHATSMLYDLPELRWMKQAPALPKNALKMGNFGDYMQYKAFQRCVDSIVLDMLLSMGLPSNYDPTTKNPDLSTIDPGPVADSFMNGVVECGIVLHNESGKTNKTILNLSPRHAILGVYAHALTAQTADKECFADEYQCLDKTCIPLTWKCDGEFYDCADKTDERYPYCPKESECKYANDTKCARDGVAPCVRIDDVCNGKQDCGDEAVTDEKNCDLCLEKGHFECGPDINKNKQCVHNEKICNGYCDCKNSVEKCLDEHQDTCKKWNKEKVLTNIGSNIDISSCVHFCDERCLEAHWICDKAQDCKDGSDEANCGFASTSTTTSSTTAPPSASRRKRQVPTNAFQTSYPNAQENNFTSIHTLRIHYTPNNRDDLISYIRLLAGKSWSRLKAAKYKDSNGRLNVTKVSADVSFDVEDVFRECRAFGLTFDCKKYIKPHFDPKYGSCFIMQHGNLTQKEAGLGLALLVRTNAMQAYKAPGGGAFYPALYDGIAMRFLKDDLSSASHDYHIKSSHIAFIHPTQTDIDRSVSESFDECKTKMDTRITNINDYTASACQLECYYQSIRDNCDCLPPVSSSKLKVNDVPACQSYDEQKCWKQASFKKEKSCTDQCLPACKETSYKADVAYQKMPSLEVANIVSKIPHLMLYALTYYSSGPDDGINVLRDVPWAKDYTVATDDLTRSKVALEMLAGELQDSDDLDASTSSTSNTGSSDTVTGSTTETPGDVFEAGPTSDRPNREVFNVTAATEANYDGLYGYTAASATSDTELDEDEQQREALVEKLANPAKRAELLGGIISEFVSQYERSPEPVERIEYNTPGQKLEYCEFKSAQAVPEQRRQTNDGCQIASEQYLASWEKEHTLLLVAFEDFMVESIELRMALGWEDFLGQIGGALGLWLGGSLMSCVHVLVFVCQWLFPSLDPEQPEETISPQKRDDREAGPKDMDTKKGFDDMYRAESMGGVPPVPR